MSDDERKQLELLASAEKALSDAVISLAGALGLEDDHVRRTDLEIIEGSLKKQQRRIEGFSRHLHRKLREDREHVSRSEAASGKSAGRP